MKIKKKKAPSIYNDSHIKKRKPLSMPSLPKTLLLLPLLLIVIRFGNIILCYHINKLQLKRDPATRIENYKFFGLSNYKKVKKEFLILTGLQPKKTFIACYYDMSHPLVFLINKNDNVLFNDLGPLFINLKPGLTEITFYRFDFLKMKQNETIKIKYFGHSILKSTFKNISKILIKDLNKDKKISQKISYVAKRLERSKYLRIPYFLYFYIPLVLILLLSSQFSHASFVGFFYYIEAFILFDVKAFFAIGPFFWITKLINIKISSTSAWIVSITLIAAFSVLVIKGLLNLKNVEYNSWEKFFILFFILLPISLRF